MKQMPVEAKKFAKIDKDWAKVMAKSAETSNVVACCANELLKNQLPSSRIPPAKSPLNSPYFVSPLVGENCGNSNTSIGANSTQRRKKKGLRRDPVLNVRQEKVNGC